MNLDITDVARTVESVVDDGYKPSRPMDDGWGYFVGELFEDEAVMVKVEVVREDGTGILTRLNDIRNSGNHPVRLRILAGDEANTVTNGTLATEVFDETSTGEMYEWIESKSGIIEIVAE